MSRDIASDASARFTLRNAMALRRRDHEVIVALVDDAVAVKRGIESSAILARLLGAGVQVYADEQILARLPATPELQSIVRAGDAELGALMLRPSINTLWC
jgi:hypothetical protein